MKTTVFIKLKAIPNCSTTEFSSVMDDGCYKIRLKAPPFQGKANAELIKWISRQFAVPRDSVLIKTGTGSRRKTLKITSPSHIPGWFHE